MHALTKAMIEEHGTTEFYCNCCGRKLNPKTMTWLELNNATGEYARAGKAPWSDGPDSQGCFEYGQACARRVLREQKF